VRRKRAPKKTVAEVEAQRLVGEYQALFLSLTEGMSRSELAEVLGISPGRVSQLQRGDGNPTLKLIATLGARLGVRFVVKVEKL
jgi:transcriptional regulator with XRE-family HTH domain